MASSLERVRRYSPGQDDRYWWPQQKRFLEVFQRTLDARQAFRVAYPRGSRQHSWRLLRLPKIQRAMAKITQDVCEQAGLTEKDVALRLKELMEGDNLRVALGAIRTVLEVKGEIGARAVPKKRKDIPAERINFQDIIAEALKGMPNDAGE